MTAPSWSALWQRLVAVWQTRRLTFKFCRDCGVPLVAKERDWCTDCLDIRLVNPPLDPAGLHQAYALHNAQQYMVAQQANEQLRLQSMLACQQHTPTPEEQQRMLAAQQGSQNPYGGLGALGNTLSGLLGRGPFS